MDNKVKFYEKNWFMWATLILFAPVGIFLMWKYRRFGKVPKVILSCVFGIWFLLFASSFQTATQSYNTASVLNQTPTQVNDQTSTNKKLATDLDKKISALGDTKSVVLDQSADVKAIRLSYEDLTTAQKGLVTKLTLLTAAEKTITDLQATADKVIADKAATDKVVANKAAAVANSSFIVQSQNNEYTVYITNTGKKYHRAGCRYLSKSQTAISKSDAISSGYSPCSVCNP